MLGRRGLPYLLGFHVILPLLAPVIDIATLYAVVVTRSPTLLYFWLGFMILQFLTAAYAFRLDGERLGPLWSLPLQQIVYRQLMYLVVVQSVATAWYGFRLRWQASSGPGRWTPLRSVPAPDVTVARRVAQASTLRRSRSAQRRR